MKKIKIFSIIICSFLLPFNALAYSDYLYLGGESIGIEIKSKGILIVGFYQVNGKYNKGTKEIKIGDSIIKVKDEEVNTIEELIDNIEENMVNDKVELTLLRDNKTFTTILKLNKVQGKYKTGLYVKDSLMGIGTLTYIDPESNIYGALGHEIIETNTNKKVEVKSGKIFKSSVTSIDRSVEGRPGGKNARFYSNKVFGDIDDNQKTGIYGTYTTKIKDKVKLPIVETDKIKKGKAYIYTVTSGDKPEKYEIEIDKIDINHGNKNLHFKVTDKKLLEKTGGIIQGMSGSPILQNDKIIGAVTHVVISKPSTGYGISIIKMLEDGDKYAK